MAEILAITTMPMNNQITIPKEVREHLGTEDGDKLYWIRGRDRQVFIVREIVIPGIDT